MTTMQQSIDGGRKRCQVAKGVRNRQSAILSNKLAPDTFSAPINGVNVPAGTLIAMSQITGDDGADGGVGDHASKRKPAFIGDAMTPGQSFKKLDNKISLNIKMPSQADKVKAFRDGVLAIRKHVGDFTIDNDLFASFNNWCQFILTRPGAG